VTQCAAVSAAATVRGALFVAFCALLALGTVRAGGDSGKAAFSPRDLAQRRLELQKEVQMLDLEVAVAKTKQAYAVLDPTARKLLFRVRGRTMKDYPVVGLSWGRRGKREGALFGRSYKLVSQAGKEIPVEITGAMAQPDPRPNGKPVTAAAMIAPNPPHRYFWRFDNGLSIYVQEDAPLDDEARRAERWISFARGLGRKWLDFRGESPSGEVLYLLMEKEHSREAYRSLLPGQTLILLTPAL
jgi:hypothetical protein